MKLEKYTAAVIGLGRIGFTLGLDRRREQPASHTMTLLQNKRISLVAGCDTDAGRCEAWRAEVPKAAVYSNTAHLFAACKPDIVVIAVNEDSHLETALTVIKSRPRLVILEKPVALTMADGLKIAEAVAEYGVPVLVNHERRFSADYMLAHEYMKRIGSIQRITAELHSGLRVYSPEDEKTGAYSLIHDGTHLVDIVHYLLEDEKLQFPVITGIYLDPDDKNVVRNVCAHYHTAACADISLSFSGRSTFFGFEVDILGTKGRIRIGNGLAEFYKVAESTLYSGFYSLAKDTSVKVPKKTGYFANMLQNGIDYLDGKHPLRSTLLNGLDDLEVLEDIKKQITTFYLR